jgi:hypothetical protein
LLTFNFYNYYLAYLELKSPYSLMSNQQLKKFFAKIKSHQIAATISAKANIPVGNYANLVNLIHC